MASTAIFVGIRGGVIALDRTTGQQLWKTQLKGADFVNLLVERDRIIAATKGEVFCLDAATGQIVWRNALPTAKEWGVVTIATASGSTGATPAFREKQRRDDVTASTA